MKTTVPAAPVPFTVSIPTGTTSITLDLTVDNLDPSADNEFILNFSAIACAVSLAEDFEASPGSQCGTMGQNNAAPVNGLVIDRSIVAGGTYKSRLTGTFTTVGAGASITITPALGASSYDYEVTAALA